MKKSIIAVAALLLLGTTFSFAKGNGGRKGNGQCIRQQKQIQKKDGSGNGQCIRQQKQIQKKDGSGNGQGDKNQQRLQKKDGSGNGQCKGCE